MQTPIQSLFVLNINKLMNQRNINTLRSLSTLANINYNTLRCWMSYSKTPRLSSLDKMCDQLGIRTYMLFHPKPDFSFLSSLPQNNSRESIRINLIVFLREKYKTSSANRTLTDFDSLISRDAYISYIRPRNGRCMRLETLYQISSYLSIEPYELLM